jgi:hypothetical protein
MKEAEKLPTNETRSALVLAPETSSAKVGMLNAEKHIAIAKIAERIFFFIVFPPIKVLK